jgi:hypothetical protein
MGNLHGGDPSMDSERAKPAVSHKDSAFVITTSSHTTNRLPDQRNAPEIKAPL